MMPVKLLLEDDGQPPRAMGDGELIVINQNVMEIMLDPKGLTTLQ